MDSLARYSYPVINWDDVRDIIRDDDMLKHKIKYDNARLRLEKQKLEPVSMPDKAYSGIPASLVAPR